ncbi:MAG: PQQ-binding-like beta-propeller repeat protein, partial [Planctomycetes bacterium]|nr:PQQ-binding-like beta-propeller repeat protein [Planctomycetota bacterium]
GDLYFNTNNRFQNPSESHVGEAEPSGQDGMIAYPAATGDQLCHLPGKYRVLVSDDVVYAAGGGSIEAIELGALRRKNRIGEKDATWTTPHAERVYCLAMAGETLLTGNRDRIAAYRVTDGKAVWGVDVKGEQVRGMAIAGGRLVAAMHTGTLRCFGPGRGATAAPKRVKEEPRLEAVPDEMKKRAEDIVERSGKSEGYALVVGEPDARLAETLARQTRLHVVGLLDDADQVARERERLLDAGLLGSRVAVHAVEEPANVGLPPYFADLVVVSGAAEEVLPKQCYRACRPCGGVLLLVGFDAAAREEFVRRAEIPQSEMEGSLVVRGKLPGAGEWRYPWADGGRSGIGGESLVRFPMQLLWFGGPGPGRLMDRHLMGSPPISSGGRVFLQGQHDVLATDAYNGRELWSRPIREVGRKYAQYYSSSLVADAQSVYVVAQDKCHRLDQATGETVATYAVPASVVDETAAPNVPDYMDVEWPIAWQVVGPFAKGKPPLSGEAFRTVPERVTVEGKEYVASKLEATGDTIDFTALFGGYDLKPLAPGQKPAVHPRRGKQFSFHDVGRIAYAAATIDCPKAGTLLVGAGADWGMQWFLDGEPVFNALRSDSSSARRGFFSRAPCAPTDRLFDLKVTAGKHVLAVMVTAGSRGWALSSASMGGRVKEVMPISTGENPNVPNLRDLDWGYLSVTDDLLLGSYNVPVAEGQPAESHLLSRSESKALFALNKRDGSLRWVYRPRGERIVANIEIAFGDGRLFLIDGTSKADLVRAKRRNTKIEAELALVALDLADGRELWRQRDVPLLGDRGALSRLKTNITHLFMGQPSWAHLVYADGVVLYGANAAYDAATGEGLWQKSTPPGKMPVVYGNRVITASNAYDLRTGEPCTAEDMLTGESVPWRYLRAYGCGPVAGCKNVLFFRSGADGFFDMETEALTNFGGVRAGCARTLLAAGGLLIHPQGYSGCCCSYNYKTNLALVAAPDGSDTWYVFPRRAQSGLVGRVAVNFGAPGDRRDSQKTAWLGFPRPIVEGACPASVAVSMSRAACR